MPTVPLQLDVIAAVQRIRNSTTLQDIQRVANVGRRSRRVLILSFLQYLSYYPMKIGDHVTIGEDTIVGGSYDWLVCPYWQELHYCRSFAVCIRAAHRRSPPTRSGHFRHHQGLLPYHG